MGESPPTQSATIPEVAAVKTFFPSMKWEMEHAGWRNFYALVYSILSRLPVILSDMYRAFIHPVQSTAMIVTFPVKTRYILRDRREGLKPIEITLGLSSFCRASTEAKN